MFPVWREEHHSGSQHFINDGSYTLFALVFLLTVVLCCVMEGLNTGPALLCVEFAGAPSMCSSFSSHSLKTSVHGCWRPRIPYWSKCFSDHSADPSNASASNTPQSEMSRQIWTVYGNLECCDSQSFMEISVFALDVLWKTASNACAAVTCRTTGF